jgi:superfamily II DNA/RNA helicase
LQIVDETDRLLKQSYQGWLEKVLEALEESPETGEKPRVVKLMASATLTHDPAKIAKLHLHCPRCGVNTVGMLIIEPFWIFFCGGKTQELLRLCSRYPKKS